MDKIKISEVSDRFGTKALYGYRYEISVKSDDNGFITVTNNNSEKDISSGYIYLLRIQRINPTPTNNGGRMYANDGVHKCFKRGLYYGGLIIKEKPYIYSTTLDGSYNIDDVTLPEKIYTIQDIDFNLNNNCEIKVCFYVCTEEVILAQRTNINSDANSTNNYMYDDVVELLKEYGIENKELSKKLTEQKIRYAKTYHIQIINMSGDSKQSMEDYKNKLDSELDNKMNKINNN